MKLKAALFLSASLFLGGCAVFDNFFAGIFSPKYRDPGGMTFASDFAGLAGKSVVVVVMVPRATLDEFPGTREEITSFVVVDMREFMPTTRTLDPQRREVIHFQDDTLNWTSLSERDIGKHFSVDKVLMIEVLDYSTRRLPGYAEMQGRLRAQVRVTDCGPTAPSGISEPEWSGIIDVRWPSDRALEPSQTNEAAVRLRLLEAFARRLGVCFHGDAPRTAVPG
jgi:hypothetical protein